MNEQPLDDFWTDDVALFEGVFRYYRKKPRPVRGKIHLSQERYFAIDREIVPIKTPQGTCTYVMLHPYVFEPVRTLNVGLYTHPKQYADQAAAIGEVLSSRQTLGACDCCLDGYTQSGYACECAHHRIVVDRQGVREVEIGNAQAWYYPADATLVLWECYLSSFVRDVPFAEDAHMKKLWSSFEAWLRQQFPQATRIATPFNDPIAPTIEAYQTFLRSLGYAPVAKAAFGKQLV